MYLLVPTNGHTFSIPPWFDVDITSRRQRPNLEKSHMISMYFLIQWFSFADWKIHLCSTYFFWRNFDGCKIHLVPTYFFRRNFAGREIHVVSTYYFRLNIDGRKVHVVSMYFFRRNFDGQKMHVVSRYFSWCNFTGQNIYVFSMYFFGCNFSSRKIHVVFTKSSSPIFLLPLTFFDVVLMVEKSRFLLFTPKFRQLKIQCCFWLSCKLIKKFVWIFLC